MEISCPIDSDGESERSVPVGLKTGSDSARRSLTDTPSSISTDGPLCRICQVGSSHEPLLSPCYCKGSLGLIHRTCVEKWLSQSNSDQCEICKFRYATVRHPKSLWQWLRETDTHTDHRHLLADIACFLLVLPLAATSAWLCVSGGLHYLRHPSVTSWEGCGLIALASILALVFLCWSYVTVRVVKHRILKFVSQEQRVKEKVFGVLPEYTGGVEWILPPDLIVWRYHWHVWQVWRSRNFNIELRDVKKTRRNRDTVQGSESTSSFVFVRETDPTTTTKNDRQHQVVATGER